MPKQTKRPSVKMTLFKRKDKPLNADELAKLSPERVKIAKIFKKHIDAAVLELGSGYDIALQGSFASTPLRIVVEISAKEEIP